MILSRRSFAQAALAAFPVALASGQGPAKADPLPSWNDGKSKTVIRDFVSNVTNNSGPQFVPVEDRIAVFDLDGTIVPENPMPIEIAFVFDQVKGSVDKHPEWKTKQPFKAVLENDILGLIAQGKVALVELVLATHTGMTTEEFDELVKTWIKAARHPRFQKPYHELAYLPMLEVLTYLRTHQFKTYVVSASGVEFLRNWSRDAYGIPPEQVVGSMFKTEYQEQANGPVLKILPEAIHIDDKAGKPVGIHQVIGKRPIAAFGNSDGDLQMLEWVTTRKGPSFGLLVHHTDAEREWAYDRKPKSSGKLDLALDAAQMRGWTLANMKNDWNRVFSF